MVFKNKEQLLKDVFSSDELQTPGIKLSFLYVKCQAEQK